MQSEKILNEFFIILDQYEKEQTKMDTFQLIVKYDPIYNCIMVSFGDEILFDGGAVETYKKEHGEIRNDIVFDLKAVPGVAAIGGISNEIRFYLVNSETVGSVFPRIVEEVVDCFGVNVTVKQIPITRNGQLVYFNVGVDYTPI